MSVDIAWDQITSGDDGLTLAESIRAFIHAKFQQITLPRFINTVQVHSFEFGSACPKVEIKDICDPLPEFYEDDEDDIDDDGLRHTGSSVADIHEVSSAVTGFGRSAGDEIHPRELHDRVAALQVSESGTGLPSDQHIATNAHRTREPQNMIQRPFQGVSGSFARSGTPGIPGGTSNMNYFHFPMSGLSGSQTPLAAVAGGGPFATQAWLRDQQHQHYSATNPYGFDPELDLQHDATNAGQTRPRTTGSVSSPEVGSPFFPSSPEKRAIGHMTAEKVSDDISTSDILATPLRADADKVSPSDLQVIAHVTYHGDVRMMLTAEIMLDYPMPSFIKIPLKLSITSMIFDGVAILAYIDKKMHFCFLDPEDAETLVGDSQIDIEVQQQKSPNKRQKIASLLREMQVETEIGRQESGKQGLKNVGKVESFVLEQVRRIFEDEFVFPSFWTFLV